ncbi:hypothetical protein EON65_50455, partial [archaeon]
MHLCGHLDHTLSVYTPIPVQGGSVDLDEETQLPSGILRERAVEPLVAALQRHKTLQQQRVFLQTGLGLCSERGLTCVQTNDEGCLQVYREMQGAISGYFMPRLYICNALYACGLHIIPYPLQYLYTSYLTCLYASRAPATTRAADHPPHRLALRP